MRTCAKHASLTLLATLILCVTAAVSSANRGIGIETGGRSVTLTSERLVFESGGVNVTCPVTLTATLASGLAKIEQVSPGEVTRATIGEASCTGGRATVLSGTLPWHVDYYAFTGTLPSISSVTLGMYRFAALVEALGVGCLFEGVSRASTVGGTEVRELRVDETVRIPIGRRLSAFCPAEGKISGTFRVSPVVRLSLVESLLGSTISASPNPLIVPATSANGIITLTAVGGTVTINQVIPVPNPNEAAFTATGCVGSSIAAGGTCSVTVAPIGANRPTNGTVIINYLDNFNFARQTSVTIRIE
jgi:hypothetical protein